MKNSLKTKKIKLLTFDCCTKALRWRERNEKLWKVRKTFEFANSWNREKLNLLWNMVMMYNDDFNRNMWNKNKNHENIKWEKLSSWVFRFQDYGDWWRQIYIQLLFCIWSAQKLQIAMSRQFWIFMSSWTNITRKLMKSESSLMRKFNGLEKFEFQDF